MIREEIKVILEGKVYSLVQCAFMADQNLWFQNLGIQQPVDHQIALLEQVFGVIDEIFSQA